MDYAKLLEQDPYSMDRREKTRVMTEGLLELKEPQEQRGRREQRQRLGRGHLEVTVFDSQEMESYL